MAKEIKDYKKAFELAAWAVVNANGFECDLCENLHEWDDHCENVDGNCAVCENKTCICKKCDGKTNFVFSIERAEKVKEKLENEL